MAVNLWTQEFRYRSDADAVPRPAGTVARYAGSRDCRSCHERFYELWSGSHHGTAMQPVTAALLRRLVPADHPIEVDGCQTSVDLAAGEVVEEQGGKRTTYPMVHAMGGKNVSFFLTPLPGGRLQVLPLAYDVRRREWFDTTGSMVRHFADRTDAAIHWQDRLLTFNTACYNCHVSQLDRNYDLATDTYRTTWREPGINCEACHGPSLEHSRSCRAVPQGTVPKDLRTIRWRGFSTRQRNDACSPCHAKQSPVAERFVPGSRFFDHYDLACLEDPDFYADGRDLGENYTLTGWMMNPCARSGTLDCVHCHTSSGRFRQHDDPSASCLPCHAERVRGIRGHSHHAPGPNAPTCVSCHMPTTEFSRMRRSDHSFRPPAPSASLQFGSPNACVLCHTGKNDDWAAGKVEEWYPQGRWRETIRRQGLLIEAARKGQWQRLPEMLEYLQDAAADPVVVTSLVRLLQRCPQPGKWPAIRQCLANGSPLVRGAAAGALGEDLGAEVTVQGLLKALADDARLVRVRAVMSLAAYPRQAIPAAHLAAVARAETELLASFSAQPDAWSSHYNLGNYRSARGDLSGALLAYDQAIKLRRDVVMPYVNAAVTASQLGRLRDSIGYLQSAWRAAPDHAAVNLNLGLALAETGDTVAAEKHLRVALDAPDARGQAAYNLAVLVAGRDPTETVRLCRLATESAPDNPRYGYTLAYYLAGTAPAEAARILEALVARHPGEVEARLLLGQCYRRVGRVADAARQYRSLCEDAGVPADARREAAHRLQELAEESGTAPP